MTAQAEMFSSVHTLPRMGGSLADDIDALNMAASGSLLVDQKVRVRGRAYARPMAMSDAEREEVFRRSRVNPKTVGPHWCRLAITGWLPILVGLSDGPICFQWRVGGGIATAKQVGFTVAGCVKHGRDFYSVTPARLILGALWCPWVSDAFDLAQIHEPLSLDWTVAIDRMLGEGHPTAEDLAMLSARGPADPIVRALMTVHHKADWLTAGQIAERWTAAWPDGGQVEIDPEGLGWSTILHQPVPRERVVEAAMRAVLTAGPGFMLTCHSWLSAHSSAALMDPATRFSPTAVHAIERSWLERGRPR